MQIIEVTGFGARTVILHLKRRKSPMQFVVFAMVHLADATFYAEVQRRLEGCQIVVAEGIQGPSTSADALTRTYRWL